MTDSKLQMADISKKNPTKRLAVAEAKVLMRKDTFKKLKQGRLAKGNALVCAKMAGILAAKKTAELIPLCHPLEISNVEIDFEDDLSKNILIIKGTVSCISRTGVEMEALTAVCIAALTIYDMCKPIDKGIVISDIKLLKKTGGKSGVYLRP